MSQNTVITVEATVMSSIDKVWACWTEPRHIIKWNSASEDWHTPRSENDIRVGGTFSSRMEAKDGSMGFDFGGVYTEVVLHKRIAYVLGDDRRVEIDFIEESDGVHVIEKFDAENQNSAELQKMGWQAILNNFKAYTEGTTL